MSRASLERSRSRAFPLTNFPPEKQAEIAELVAQPNPPPKYLYYGAAGDARPSASMPSRAWYEWHWQRGVDPDSKRVPIRPSVRAAVIARDGYVCQLCGGDIEPVDLHLDHIKPYSKGGPSTVANLQAAHSACNVRKGTKFDAED